MTPRPDIAFVAHYPLNAAIKGDDVDWTLVPVDLNVGRDLADRLTFLRNVTGTDAFGEPLVAPGASPPVEHDTTGDDARPAASPVEDEFGLTEADADGPGDVVCANGCDAPFGVRCSVCNSPNLAVGSTVKEALQERRRYRDLAATATQLDDVGYLNDHPDEGDDVDAATVASVGERYKALSDDRRSWVTKVGANVRLNPSTGGVASERRRLLLTSLIDLSADFDQDDVVRGICRRYLGDVADFANVTPAALVGALGIDEARKFHNAAKALIAGNASVRWDERRRCHVERAA